MNKSELLDQLGPALAKAQAKIKPAIKDQDNPFFKSKYADLAAVWEVVREPLTSNGVTVIQIPTTDAAKVSVETVLLHSSGQYISGTLTVTAAQTTAQAIGSAITYLRRYALAAFCGVAQDDDDGNAATRDSGNKKISSHDIFDETNEQHRKMLRGALQKREIKTSTQALAAFDTMKGKPLSDIDSVVDKIKGVTNEVPHM